MFLESKVRLVRKAYNLAVICEPIASTMWDPQHLTTLQASTACYRESFYFHKPIIIIHTNKKTNSIENLYFRYVKNRSDIKDIFWF
jgi:hypothetical protein